MIQKIVLVLLCETEKLHLTMFLRQKMFRIQNINQTINHFGILTYGRSKQ